MAVLITKELILANDIEFGFDISDQSRGGSQFNAAYLPYDLTESVAQALMARYTSVYIDASFAPINGSSTTLFDVANGTADFEAVNFQQLALKADQSLMDAKADKANVLELDNTAPYAPLTDYNPATKKHVDDSIYTAFQTGVSGSFESADGKTITVTNGLVTGII